MKSAVPHYILAHLLLWITVAYAQEVPAVLHTTDQWALLQPPAETHGVVCEPVNLQVSLFESTQIEDQPLRFVDVPDHLHMDPRYVSTGSYPIFTDEYGSGRFFASDRRAAGKDDNNTLHEIVPPPNHFVNGVAVYLGVGSLAGLSFYSLAPNGFLRDINNGEDVGDPFENFKRGFSEPPIFDKDPFLVNYLGHPYFGMQYYLYERNHNASVMRSFAFTTILHTGFEYFVEVYGEQPSVQDLISGPIGGLVLGELNYQLTKKMREHGFTTFEKIVLTILNPLYVWQHGYR